VILFDEEGFLFYVFGWMIDISIGNWGRSEGKKEVFVLKVDSL
jgi:hypothetical protein